MFRYRDDTETGLYYLNSRYYNAEWGRFINADAVGGKVGTLLSHNVFAYCFNNPVNMDDPSGYWPMPRWVKNIFKGIISAIKSLEAEVGGGAGLGLGGKFKIGKQSLDLELGGYIEKLTIRANNDGINFGSSVQAAASVGIPFVIKSVIEYKAFAPFKNAIGYDPLYDIENQPNSQVEQNSYTELLGRKVLKGKMEVKGISNQNDFKIGLEVKVSVGVHGRAELNFNVSEFIRLFNE